VRRLSRIVDEFGRFARLPAPAPRAVAPGELVAAVAALYPDAGPVRVACAVAPDLPPVQADPDQLGQVLHNLVKNGLEAVGAAGTVRVSARLDGGELELAVADDGPGLSPEAQARAFEPYFTTKAGGTGLGLAISERIVREHGGRIEVRSTPGSGATFAVRLPVGPASAPGSP
jgi:signal transduction histidine kinase